MRSRERAACSLPTRCSPDLARTGGGMWGFAATACARHRHDGKTDGQRLSDGRCRRRGRNCSTTFCDETGYFNTFGGNPVAAAAGLAVLDVIRDEGLVDQCCATVGACSLKSLRRSLMANHAAIGDVRGAGLFIGLDFNDPETRRSGCPRMATRVINALQGARHPDRRGRSLRQHAEDPAALCFTSDDAAFFTDTLRSVLQTC